MSKEVLDYIDRTWDATVRQTHEDEDTLLALPYPYTVPSSEGRFREMYYWDTYFTNAGLLKSGRVELAKDNVMNMAYLIHRYGFMPNGNRTYYLYNSQPPFFSQMVREIYEVTGDKEWLAEMFKAVRTEYAFWMDQRMTPCGLNRFFGSYENDAQRKRMADHMCDRFCMEPAHDEATVKEYADCFREFCESGWDCNSRKGTDAHHYCTPDQNGLLYGMEQNMAYFAEELGEDGALWRECAAARKEKMDTWLWNEQRGAYFDYNFVTKTQSDLFSVASLYPLVYGMADQKQAEATFRLLPLLERDYGVACCENTPAVQNLQWDYPYGWACLQYMTVQALRRYGRTQDAKRIMEKYIRVVDLNYAETGRLWEKYNMETGEIAKAKEYVTPEMMGWTAGVYTYFSNVLPTL